MEKDFDVKKAQRQAKQFAESGKHQSTLKCILKIADFYYCYGQFDKAKEEYEKGYAFDSEPMTSAIQSLKTEARIKWYLSQPHNDVDNIPEFENYIEETLDGSDAMIFQLKSQKGAEFFIRLKQWDQARKHAMLAFENLVQNDINYELKKCQALYNLAQIASADKNHQEVNDYCRRALEFKRIDNYPKLYFDVLNFNLTSISRAQKYEHVEIMQRLCTANKLLLKPQKFSLNFALLHAYLSNDEIREAEEILSKFYFSEDECEVEKKEEVIKLMVAIHKLNVQRKKFERMIEEDEEQQAEEGTNVAQLAESIGTLYFILKVYDKAFEYFLKMKRIAKKLPHGITRDFWMERALLFGNYSLEKFAVTQLHYELLYFAERKLVKLLKRRNASDEKIWHHRLMKAVRLAKINTASFSKKDRAFNGVKDNLQNDFDQLIYHRERLNLFQQMQVADIQHDVPLNFLLETNYKLIKERLKDAPQPAALAPSSTYRDHLSDVSDDEILGRIEKRWNITKYRKLINWKNRMGETKLHLAILQEDALDTIKLMIEECGFDGKLNEIDNCGRSPLFYAAMEEKNDVCEYFVGCGADVNIQTTTGTTENPAGGTALIEAASQGNIPLIKLLLDNGADTSFKDEADKNAEDYLAEWYRLFTLPPHKYNNPRIFSDAEKNEIKVLWKRLNDLSKENTKQKTRVKRVCFDLPPSPSSSSSKKSCQR